MESGNRLIALAVVALFLVAALALLFLPRDGNDAGGKMTVAVTILPQKQFAERIGGEKVRAITMIPPGASAHTYEPIPSQLAEVSSAKAYFKVGSGVEFELSWLDKLARSSPGMPVFDCSKGIELIDATLPDDDEGDGAAHGGAGGQGAMKDPHIWNSPKNAIIMAENIYGGLAQIDPQNEGYYRKNLEEYVSELSALDDSIRVSLTGEKNRKFIVYHPAWGYFAHEYGLEQIGVEESGKEPTAQGIESVIAQAKSAGINIIFASPEYSEKSAEVIADEIGGRVILISPLAEDYLSNMGLISEAISDSMR